MQLGGPFYAGPLYDIEFLSPHLAYSVALMYHASRLSSQHYVLSICCYVLIP